MYWGNSSGWGKGKGDGPWVMGDLENGLFAGQDHVAAEPSVVGMKFVTAMVKGDSGNHWAIKVGDAQKGALKTVFDGERPKGYSPMKKQVPSPQCHHTTPSVLPERRGTREESRPLPDEEDAGGRGHRLPALHLC